MLNELQQSLYIKFPDLFKQKDLPMSETCMCWGITCGEGWYGILLRMCIKIQEVIKDKKEHYPQAEFKVEFTQVKEKFGTLRVYYVTQVLNNGEDISEFTEKNFNNSIDRIIQSALVESNYTCEQCGLERGWIAYGPYLQTLCDTCRGESPYKSTDRWIEQNSRTESKINN